MLAVTHISRIRKVKCDESFPVCRRCRETGRKCDGFDLHTMPTALRTQRSTNNIDILHEPSLLITRLRPDEYFAFQFFLKEMFPMLVATRDAYFWTGPILQLSNSEPAVLDALAVVGCLYQEYAHTDVIESLCNPSTNRFRNLLALRLYSRSVAGLRKRSEESNNSEVVMICFCLFIAIEIMQNDFEQVGALYNTAARLLYSSPRMAKSPFHQTPLEASVSGMLLTGGVLGSVSGIRFNLESKSNNNVNHFSLPQEQISTDISSGLHAILGEIQDFLSIICRKVLSHISRAYGTNAFEATQHELKKSFLMSRGQNAFERAQTELEKLVLPSCEEPLDLSFSSTLHTREDFCTMSILCSYASIAQSWLNVCVDTSELAWDRQMEHFEKVIQFARSGLEAHLQSQTNSLRFKIGLIAPLYFTALKCRSRQMRREAKELLTQLSDENMHYLIHPTIKIIERVVDIEEEGLPSYIYEKSSPGNDALPAEGSRITCLNIMTQNQGHSWQVFIGWRKSTSPDELRSSAQSIEEVAEFRSP